MYHSETTKNHVIANFYMSGQLRVVGENGVITYLAIMREMHVGHYPVVITYTGNADILCGSQIESAELAYGIVIADLQASRFVCIFFVLWYLAQ
jgi:hypothetical protein